MVIIYASQSGTAEGFAYELEKQAKMFGFKPKVVDIEDYDYEEDLSKETLVLFLLATFGEGDPTDSMIQFNDWMMNDDREEDLLTDAFKFAVFSLGNKQYEHFAAIGKRIHEKLVKCGGSALLEVACGDDDDCIEDDFTKWQHEIWPILRKKYLGYDGSDDSFGTEKFVPSIGVEYYVDKAAHQTLYDSYEKQVFKPDQSKHASWFVPVTTNIQLRQVPSAFESTLHIELDISNSPVKYITADNLGVCPRNDYRLASQVAKCLKVRTDTLMKISKLDAASSHKTRLPSLATVKDLLLWYVDFTALCKKKLLETFATFATDPDERDEMLRLTSPEGKDDYDHLQLSIFEVLDKWPSVSISFENFVEICPRLQPRFYTISSSSKVHPNSIHVTVALNHTPKSNDRHHAGVCSTYLASLRPGKDELPIFVRASSFRLPRPLTKPVIMIGPGTGVAPFRAFVQELRALKADGMECGSAFLYFGCRQATVDYLYKDEMELAHGEGVLTKLHTAFSRETDKKVYVQDLMAQHLDELWSFVEDKKAVVYVCGGTTMGRSIREVMCAMAMKHGGLNSSNAELYLKNLQDKNRYIQELWG